MLSGEGYYIRDFGGKNDCVVWVSIDVTDNFLQTYCNNTVNTW